MEPPNKGHVGDIGHAIFGTSNSVLCIIQCRPYFGGSTIGGSTVDAIEILGHAVNDEPGVLLRKGGLRI